MKKRDKQIYAMHWQGIDIEVTYCPDWSEAYRETYGAPLAHLTCRAIYPHKARLPITETGYRSHFTSASLIEDEGGPVAFLSAWLDEAAELPDWQRHLEAQRQPMWTPALTYRDRRHSDLLAALRWWSGLMEQRGLFSLSEHLEKLSEHGDPLEVLGTTVDFEHFRGRLVEGLGYGNGSKGGRPPFDPVSMFKALILQAQHNLSDAKMEFMIRDRLSWMRFLDFDLGGPTPDENTIRLYRNKLTETGTLKQVMKAFDWQLRKKGYIPIGGQIVDATLVPAPKQRNTEDEKARIKAGKSAKEIWPDHPAKAAQKDTQARWTLKIGGKVRTRPDGTPLPQIALPVFGYKSHIVIDRRYGFIRNSVVTSASEADGGMLRQLVTSDNTSSAVWADSAYRSQQNEDWLASRMLTSRIHRRKPAGMPMPRATARANGRKSSVRARIEHVFAHQTERGPWPPVGPRKPSEGASGCSSAPSVWCGLRRN